MYQRLALLLGALASISALASPPHANRAVLARGEHLSRIICAQCHVVADDQRVPLTLREPTPSFREIANRPGTTRESLRYFVTHTHGDLRETPLKMPYPDLTREQVNAVIDYIMSLRTR
jgi:mono/diheme cytochrome c family protein